MARRTDATRSLPEVLDDAIRSATWLTPADSATVEISKILARELAGAMDVRDIVSLSKQLNDVLQSLGMNIAGRTGKAESERESSPLDAIKARSQIRLAKPAPIKSKVAATKSRGGSSRVGSGVGNAVAPLAGSSPKRIPKSQKREVGS